MAFVLGVVYMQESLTAPPDALRGPFVKVFSLLALLVAVWAWWLVLANESRRMAHDESERQTQLLQRKSTPTSAPTPRCKAPRRWPRMRVRPRRATWPV